MNFIFSFIIIASFSWSIGLQGLVIPEDAYVLSTAGSGIADGISPSLNPAMNETKQPYFQFSLNNWLGDITGSHTAYHWGKDIHHAISVQSWNAKELELWGDKPNSTPLGTFGVYYIAASYSISHHLNTSHRLGLRIQTNYSHLFSNTMSGIAIDIGALISLNKFMDVGLTIKNIGFEETNYLSGDLPIQIGIGSKIKLPFKIKVFSDGVFQVNKDTDFRIGLKTNWKWINIQAGTTINKTRNAKAMGFSFNYKHWFIVYGVYLHENPELGLPKFIDLRRYI